MKIIDQANEFIARHHQEVNCGLVLGGTFLATVGVREPIIGLLGASMAIEGLLLGQPREIDGNRVKSLDEEFYDAVCEEQIGDIAARKQQ